tara:strand:- start:1792 stop:2106 length:315 start_codon:yes stop_codon:yes gene_type:complete
MAYGSAISAGSSGELISHFTGVRMRIVGSGSLQMTFKSFDSVETQALEPFTMAAATNREPFRLANFIQQRAMLEGYTTEKDETFKINRIVLFAAPMWNEYPSGD